MLAKQLHPGAQHPLAPKAELATAAHHPGIDHGGLAGLPDIEKLCAVENEGVEGVICGRAIYSGDLDFAAAQTRADELAE